MSRSPSAKIGKVYLVGAGPGDPDMVTLRAVRCLHLADVVLYDYLANPQILHHAQGGAELVCLGKHGANSRLWSQAEINDQMVRAARQGKTVVRLKGGDPAVFARGAEEAECLAEQGIEFEIVPGITTALAAGSCAGIPVTHRQLASAVALVTGHEERDKPESALDWDALARFPGTLVVYMGVTTVGRWTSALIAAGKPATTPAAVIRHCSRADQQTIHCTLGEVTGNVQGEPKMRPPVIVIVGDVARLGPQLSWFEKRPLFGKTVLVTRPSQQASDVTAALAEFGAEVLLQPAIAIGPPAEWSAVDDALARLDSFDWIVFSSVNGVSFLLDRLLTTGQDLRALGGTRIAAIGPGTAERLEQYHLRADLTPDEYRAEALAAALSPEAHGKRFLLARASRGREVLAQQITAAGGRVEQVVVYQSIDVAHADAEVSRRLVAGEIDFVTVTSSAIARSLVALYGDALHQSKLVSISPVTSATLLQLGQPPAVEATEYTMGGVVEAILQASQ